VWAETEHFAPFLKKNSYDISLKPFTDKGFIVSNFSIVTRMIDLIFSHVSEITPPVKVRGLFEVAKFWFFLPLYCGKNEGKRSIK
jgi:hypothetical protein